MHLLRKYFLLALIILIIPVGFAQTREIALTIDDMPFVGESKNFHLNLIIEALQANNIPATGFVIAGEISQANWEMLNKFREAGFGIGNHTMTHANLNKMTSDAYIHEISKADKILAPVLTKPKFFRYPYMAVGEGSKKETVKNYLLTKHYQAAPITIDSKDFIFNQLLLSVDQNERRFFLNVLKPCYVDFIWEQTLKAEEHNRLAKKSNQAQILLIHANLLNAYVLQDIIKMYLNNGYTFVTLEQALGSSQIKKIPSKKQSKKSLYSSNDSILDSYMAWD